MAMRWQAYQDGYDNGFADGLARRPFRDVPDQKSIHRGKNAAAAYSSGYEDGYYDGERLAPGFTFGIGY